LIGQGANAEKKIRAIIPYEIPISDVTYLAADIMWYQRILLWLLPWVVRMYSYYLLEFGALEKQYSFLIL